MKKFFLVLILIFLFFLSGAIIYKKNSASLTFGCAPWDGKTLELEITTSAIVYKISIWGKGYSELEDGKHTILIDNKSWSSGGVGKALKTVMILSNLLGNKYTPINLTVHFDELNLKEGSKASGWIQKLDGTKYPFQGVIEEDNCHLL